MMMELEGKQYSGYNYINKEINRLHMEIKEVEQKIYTIHKSGFLKRLLRINELRNLIEERKLLLQILSSYLKIETPKCSL